MNMYNKQNNKTSANILNDEIVKLFSLELGRGKHVIIPIQQLLEFIVIQQGNKKHMKAIRFRNDKIKVNFYLQILQLYIKYFKIIYI